MIRKKIFSRIDFEANPNKPNKNNYFKK